MRHHCLAVCAPGTEAVLRDELASLHFRPGRTVRGGVTFDASTRELYLANVWARTATRVLVRIGSFSAPTFARLEREAATLPWDAYLNGVNAVRLRVSSTRSRLYHTGAIEERLRRVASLASPDDGVPTDAPDDATALVVVRLVDDRCTISIDSSGAPLYKRGWRSASTRAPLRESLAAALLLTSGWDRVSPLVDPFCGSGTIPIEAMLLALGRAPGAHRTFAFQRWPSFAPGTWASVQADLQRGQPDRTHAPLIVATDRDEGAVATTLDNATRAGVAELLQVRRATISDLEVANDAPGPGWLVTNPPYGRRLSPGADRRDLFARFGAVARQRLPGWHLTALTDDVRVLNHSGLSWTERFRTTNGGIPVRCVTTDVGVAS